MDVVIGAIPQQWIVVLVIAGASAMLIFRSQRRLGTRPGRLPTAPLGKARTAASEQHARMGATEQWEVEMHDLARTLSAQLDSKIIAVRELVARAEAAAERLDGLLGQANGDAPESPARSTLEPREHQAVSLARQRPVRRTTANESERADARRDRRAAIYALADSGRAAEDIAHEVGLPAGEVNLILGLRGHEAAG